MQTGSKQGFTSFDSDGFTLTTGASYNGNGNDLLLGTGEQVAQGSSNTDGSINTTYTCKYNCWFFNI